MKGSLLYIWLISLTIVIGIQTAHANISLNPLFSDHMVLQQKSAVNIFGSAEPNEKITLKASFFKGALKGTADINGNWSISFKTPKYGGPYSIKITGSDDKVMISDVYIGEVWLASGQSNMEFPLDSLSKGYNGPVDFRKQVAEANFPLIRQYLVKDVVSRKELSTQQGEWLLCQPQNARRMSALAYFFSRNLHLDLKVPVGIINASWGGTSIGSWMRAMDLKTFPSDLVRLNKITHDSVKVNENYPSVLYNGMISPLKDYVIKGVIWNQGENSINNPSDYAERMRSLISGWRTTFKNEILPFLYVQMAPYNYQLRPKQWFWGTSTSLGYLVEQQTEVLQTPNVYMARTGDIGELKNIHYRNKEDVGIRLARLALKHLYGKDLGIVNGPDVEKINLTASGAIITYKNTGKGLNFKGNTISGFELSNDDQVFYPASATIKGDQVLVLSDAVARPTSVRYCFKNTDMVNLFNSAGLPALPFRTDKVPYSNSIK